ncbi:MAG: hypothetical protein A3J46_03675 [Candidatus Yanofskybacteria bacterium RIFCSPHIGHO2_02_FULL_41_11]|uniref:ComEC/Rec2-related protein domain-containing protein n=1 Tax=Candidatus Yanofskybacteria bacterium RIFCSPHIGHO2_02_FULL_41_11 TaxID=1802675 RepID=A0A1F8FAA0_9BACT|nr:MAG: hypothetical protein A3J46_03675 [Candidatus Yanofskybacteria bacterium RIFCSPHIGHO2_02_FULL_41_11]
MHKSQVLFYLLVSFVLGIFLGSFWNISASQVLFLILVGTITLTISGHNKTFGSTSRGIKRRHLGFLLGCAAIVLTLGILRFNQFDSNHNIIIQFTDDIVGGRGVDYTVSGYVMSDPEKRGNNTKFILAAKKIILPDREIVVDDNILVTTNPTDIKYGDKILVTGALASPKNFEDFDYISYLKKDGIRVLMNYPKSIVSDSDLKLAAKDRTTTSIYRPIFYVKNKFESAINKSISEPNASFINGILLGTRHGIPNDLKDAFNKTGTSHILAISGYNIAIIAWAILAALVFFVKRRVAFWISVFIIVLFTIMTGASASVVRASIMGLILLFASGYGRLHDPKNAILFAGAIMVFQNPFVLRFDIGFQLSFLAVMGIIYLQPLLKEQFKTIPDILKLKELSLITISAHVFVLPTLIYYFGALSLVSLPANILVLPFLPVTMFLGFVTGLTGVFVYPLAQFFGYLTWAISKYIIEVVEILSSTSYSSISVDISLPVLVIVYALIFFGIWHFTSRQK